MPDDARTDRQTIELLDELRVALPDVQILLTVPSSARFDERMSLHRSERAE